MDIEDIQSDLQALRKLYGLLRSDGCSVQNENLEYLDHKARLLLRNLLDAATERTFKAHAEILAARRGSYDTACSTKQEHPKETLKVQPPPFLTNVSNNFASGVQCTSKDLHTQKAVPENGESGTSKPVSQVVSSEQSVLKIFSSQPQVRMKRCRVCQRSKAKQMKSSYEPKPIFAISNQQNGPTFQFGQSNLLEKGPMSSQKALQTDDRIETQTRNGSSEFQSKRTEIGYSACSSSKPAEVLRKSEEADQISKEVSFKIQEIESRISDLKLASKPENPFQIKFGAQYEPISSSDPSTESVLQTKRRLVTRNDVRQVGDFVVGRNDLKSRFISQKVWEPTQWHQVPNQFRGTDKSNQAIARTLESLPPTGARFQTASQNVGRIEGITSEYDRLTQVGKPAEEFKLPKHKENHIPGKNVRVIIDRIESVSEVRSRDDHMESQPRKFGQHPRVPANWNKTGNTDILMPAKLHRQLENENFDQDRTGLKKSTGFGNVGISQPSTPSVRSKVSRLQAVDARSEFSRTRTKGEARMPDQKITRKNHLHHSPTQHRVAPRLYDDQWEENQCRARKKNHHFSPPKLISPNEVSVSTGSRSVYSSSSWTSQQVSTSFSGDEGHSVSSQTQNHRFSGSSTSIDSELYSRQGRKVGPNLSRSRSDSELYSVSSRTRGDPSDSDSSGESQDDYLSSDETPVHHHKGSSYQSLRSTTSRRRLMGPTKSRRLEKDQKPGRLKKLKDKLAFIFHHHHHHHHHHGGDDDDDDDDDTESGPHVVVKGGRALWKHAGRIIDRSKEEGYGEKAVKKTRKSSVPDKNQRGHFHALVEGLLQHVRHSKKSKPSKGGGGGGSGSGGKKVAGKLHWWQMLRAQRGSKLPKKPHGKAKMGKRNPKLKALPKP